MATVNLVDDLEWYQISKCVVPSLLGVLLTERAVFSLEDVLKIISYSRDFCLRNSSQPFHQGNATWQLSQFIVFVKHNILSFCWAAKISGTVSRLDYEGASGPLKQKTGPEQSSLFGQTWVSFLPKQDFWGRQEVTQLTNSWQSLVFRVIVTLAFRVDWVILNKYCCGWNNTIYTHSIILQYINWGRCTFDISWKYYAY